MADMARMNVYVPDALHQRLATAGEDVNASALFQEALLTFLRTKQAIIALNIRLPGELHAALRARAKANRRSLQREIVAVLQLAIDTQGDDGG